MCRGGENVTNIRFIGRGAAGPLDYTKKKKTLYLGHGSPAAAGETQEPLDLLRHLFPSVGTSASFSESRRVRQPPTADIHGRRG